MKQYEAIANNMNLNAFYDHYTSLRQQRSNGLKCWNLNNSIPMINQILSMYRIDIQGAVFDETMFILDGHTYEMLKDCKQRVHKSINYDGTVTNISLDLCMSLLNRANIHPPFSYSRCQNALYNKFTSQQIGGKVVFQSNILKYIYKITAIAIHEDTFRIKFDNNLNILDAVINEVVSGIHDNSDISNPILYDLSTLIQGNDSFIFSDDRTFDGTSIDHTIDGTNDMTSINYIYSSTGNRKLSHVHDYKKFISDLTNVFSDNTIIHILNENFYNYDATTLDSTLDSSDTTTILYTSSFLDSSISLIKEKFVFDDVNKINSMIVPFWVRTFMSNEIARFFRSRIHGYNEYIGCDDANSIIPFGDYLYSVLRLYYGFDDSLITKIFRLLLAHYQKNQNVSRAEEEVQVILGKITGHTLQSSYVNNIKSIETDIISSLADLTGMSDFIVYNNGIYDITTNIKFNYNIRLTDIYDLMKSLGKIRFIYIIDYGYDDNLIKNPICFIWSRNRSQQDIGYLEIFSATTELI